ncbi:MAG: DUF1499 domain-containing protein [Pseudomonadota bacterium]
MRTGFIWIAIIVAVVGAGAIAAAGLGHRFGVWDLKVAFGILHHMTSVPGTSFSFPTAVSISALGGVLSLVGFVLALVAGPRGLAAPALAAAVLGAGAVAPLLNMQTQLNANPFIHDVTTDFADPPQIVAAADLPRANPPDYLGDESVRKSDPPTAELQREAFPDIQPALYEAPTDVVYEAALRVVQSFGWEVLDADAERGVIEAADTSLWFGFVDDIIVRVRATETGARVDVRSKSRVGGSDLGVNAARVRKFLDRLDAEMSAA